MRAGGECELVFAAVAGAGVDVADGKASPAFGTRERDAMAESAEVTEKGEHQRSAQA
jgi:hypothetical protein